MSGPKAAERLTALCCACGRVRTVSANYWPRGGRFAPGESVPDKVLDNCQARGLYVDHKPGWRCLIELRCETCKAQTAHAYIREDQFRDTAENEDREVDRARKRVGRRVAGLQATGVKVVFRDPDQMKVEGAPVEVLEYDDEGFCVRLCMAAPPLQLLRCLEQVDDYVDDHNLIGEWRTSPRRRWRGVALMGRRS